MPALAPPIDPPGLGTFAARHVADEGVAGVVEPSFDPPRHQRLVNGDLRHVVQRHVDAHAPHQTASTTGSFMLGVSHCGGRGCVTGSLRLSLSVSTEHSSTRNRRTRPISGSVRTGNHVSPNRSACQTQCCKSTLTSGGTRMTISCVGACGEANTAFQFSTSVPLSGRTRACTVMTPGRVTMVETS